MEIPFYKNLDLYCAQACMKMIIGYFDPKNKINLDKLSELSHKRKDGGTNSTGIVLAFHDLGYEVKLYTKTLEDEQLSPETQEYYDKYGIDKKIKGSIIQKAKNKGLIIVKKLNLHNIKNFLDKKQGVIALINWNKVVDKKGYTGHFVVLTKIVGNSIYFHQPGPNDATPNKKISRELFMNAFNSEGTDNDVIIVKGKN